MKYKNLYIFILLVIIWSLLFSMFKYFVWWVFASQTVTLQYLSGYMSLWAFISYIVWWIFFEILKEKKFHFLSIFGWIFSLVLLWLLYKFWFNIAIVLALVSFLVWMFYWLWGILKNFLISNLISETKLSDTKVNWLANIFFICFVIIWSIVWWLLWEKLSFSWIFVLIWILSITIFINLFLTDSKDSITKNTKERFIDYKNNFLSDFKFIFKKYFIIMFFSTSILAIWTILSQKAIEYSVEFLHKTASQWAVLLLYTAIWSIIWNIWSMKINKNRWNYFFGIWILFAISSFAFPFILNNFFYTWVLAFICWILFWIVFNLIESYYFKKMAIDNKKSFWAVSLGLVSSINVAFFMFLVDFLQLKIWLNWVYYFLWTTILIMSVYIFVNKNKFLEN